ncbi:MAG: nucleotidyltransferase family protein, partial [Clostridia bacterium]|nr:nucleotidyltransferase family protein [Clostridia bacterium]
MKIAAVICEYNPFHKGHAYHLAETRERTGCDYIVGIMSGSFVQRGEPSVLDKWVRTEMALSCGLDAVFELPAVYALSSAQYFARGGVSLAGALGVDFLSFGSESSLEVLQGYVDVRKKGEYEKRLRQYLNEGLSYPQAATRAYGADLDRILPNDLLGIEYMSAIAELGYDIDPVAVPRKNTAHNSNQIKHGFASAKQIRTEMDGGNTCASVQAYIPAKAYSLMEKWIAEYGAASFERYNGAILARIRTMGKDTLNQMPFAGGGLG